MNEETAESCIRWVTEFQLPHVLTRIDYFMEGHYGKIRRIHMGSNGYASFIDCESNNTEFFVVADPSIDLSNSNELHLRDVKTKLPGLLRDLRIESIHDS